MTADGQQGSYPLPEDPLLAEVASALRTTGHWAYVVDHRWRLVYVTDELRRTFGAGELADFAIGHHLFGPAALAASRGYRLGSNTEELNRSLFAAFGGLAVADTGGGHDELRELVDPLLRDLIDGLQPADVTAVSYIGAGSGLGGSVTIPMMAVRIRDESGRLAGTALISKPAGGMPRLRR